MLNHEIVNFIAQQRELQGGILTSRVHWHQLRTGLAQDVESSTQGRAVFNGLEMNPAHIPLSDPYAPSGQHFGSGEGGVIHHQRDFHHHRLCGIDTTQGDKG